MKKKIRKNCLIKYCFIKNEINNVFNTYHTYIYILNYILLLIYLVINQSDMTISLRMLIDKMYICTFILIILISNTSFYSLLF